MAIKHSIDFDYTDRTAKIKFEKDGDVILSTEISESELQALRDDIDNIYYDEDVISYFEDSKDYDESVLDDADLIHEMCDYYRQRRCDHSTGGDYESVAHWTVSLDETIEEFEDRLEKYRL